MPNFSIVTEIYHTEDGPFGVEKWSASIAGPQMTAVTYGATLDELLENINSLIKWMNDEIKEMGQ